MPPVAERPPALDVPPDDSVPPAAVERPPVVDAPEAVAPPVTGGCPPVIKVAPPELMAPPVLRDPPLSDGLDPPALALPPVWTAPPVAGPEPPVGAPATPALPPVSEPLPPTRPLPPDPVEVPLPPFDGVPDEHATSPTTTENCNALRRWNTLASIGGGYLDHTTNKQRVARLLETPMDGRSTNPDEWLSLNSDFSQWIRGKPRCQPQRAGNSRRAQLPFGRSHLR